MEQERDRLKHLLIILLEALSVGKDGKKPTRARVQDKAAEAGLDEDDVHGLLDWIEDEWEMRGPAHWDPNPLPEVPSAAAVRVYGDVEQETVTREALAYLLDLQARKEINAAQLEALLHYTTLLAVLPVEKADLEMVIEQVLFRPHRPGMVGGLADGHRDIH